MLRSLRFKIAVALIVINGLSFMLMSFINYETSSRQINGQLLKHNMANLRSTVTNLETMLTLRAKEAELIGHSIPVRLRTTEDRLRYLNTYVPLTNLPARHIGIANDSGMMTMTDGSVMDIGDLPAFHNALIGLCTYSDMAMDSREYPVLWLMVPFYDMEYRLLGVIGLGLDVPDLFRSQLRINTDIEDSALVLIDRDTNLLYYKETSLILNRNYMKEEPAVREFAEKLRQSEEGYGEASVFGRVLKMFYVKIPGKDWYAVYSIAKSEFEAPLRHSLWLNMILIATTELVLGLFLYFVTHHSILKRLKQVVGVTQNVAAGNFYPAPLRIRSRDEMGLLAGSVNGMIENLQELFEPFQTFIRHNQYAMIVTDSHFVLTSFNKRAEELLGYGEREVIGKKCLLAWHDPEQLRERSRYYSDKLNSEVLPDESVLVLVPSKGFLPDWEWTWIHRDGTRKLVSLNSSVMRHPDGSPKGYVLIARDISEIKQAVATNTRLFEIMDSAHDMIASFDARGRIFYLNQAGRVFLGIDALNENNNRLSQYMPIPTTVRFADGLTEARERGYWKSEIEFIDATGATQITSINVVAHQPKDETEVYYSTIVRDISNQKEIQLQLLTAKEEADQANEAKSSFLARMSHEIRTPLNGIIGLTHLLQRSELTDLQNDYLRQISVSSHNLLRILNDILDFSKLEADKLTLESVPFRMEDLLVRLSGMFSVLLGPKPVDFIVHADPSVPEWLVGDPNRLEQVLLNLGTNAIKFTNVGLVELTISAKEIKEGEAILTFAVTDTGIGMTDEQLARLFVPFVQADEKTSRKYGGTGLGLVISGTLIDRMGGKLQARSVYHVGSAFSFDLVFPLGKTGPASIAPRYDGMKIIVLEDRNEVAEHWRTLLTSFGCEAVALPSWKDARLLVQESPWDAMIVDMEADDMHGEETWIEWKTELDRLGIRTITYTSLLGRDALQQLPDAYKPDAVIVKPSSASLVHQALQAIGHAGQAAGEPSASPAKSDGSSRVVRPLVWIVDDQIINRLVVNQLLESQQLCETVLMESGVEAVEAIEASYGRLPDLILMDLHMPDMDGIEAATRIRRSFGADRLPILALTADVTAEMHARSRAAGMNDVLTKPIEPDLLYRKLEEWLPNASGVDSPPGSSVAEDSRRDNPEWPDLPGLNATLALQRLDGKEDLYRQLLVKFVQQYADAGERLERLLEEEDPAEAIRLVHSLSGAAGHLGATCIQEAAAAMESSLKQGERPEETELRLARVLREDLETITNLLNRKRS